jgi:heme-degrading monooxygenase HmoA
VSEVVTMVSAHIAPERIADVIDAFGAAVRAGMPERRHTSLYRCDGNLVRIVTVWRSREELEQYLSGVDRRRGFAVALLEGAGGTPVIDVLELVLDSHTAWWP